MMSASWGTAAWDRQPRTSPSSSVSMRTRWPRRSSRSPERRKRRPRTPSALPSSSSRSPIGFAGRSFEPSPARLHCRSALSSGRCAATTVTVAAPQPKRHRLGEIRRRVHIAPQPRIGVRRQVDRSGIEVPLPRAGAERRRRRRRRTQREQCRAGARGVGHAANLRPPPPRSRQRPQRLWRQRRQVRGQQRDRDRVAAARDPAPCGRAGLSPASGSSGTTCGTQCAHRRARQLVVGDDDDLGTRRSSAGKPRTVSVAIASASSRRSSRLHRQPGLGHLQPLHRHDDRPRLRIRRHVWHPRDRAAAHSPRVLVPPRHRRGEAVPAHVHDPRLARCRRTSRATAASSWSPTTSARSTRLMVADYLLARGPSPAAVPGQEGTVPQAAAEMDPRGCAADPGRPRQRRRRESAVGRRRGAAPRRMHPHLSGRQRHPRPRAVADEVTHRRGAARAAVRRAGHPDRAVGPAARCSPTRHESRTCCPAPDLGAAGPPVDLSAYVGKPVTAQLLRDATTTIMRSVASLLAQLRDEQAPDEFYDAEAAMTTAATVQREGA